MVLCPTILTSCVIFGLKTSVVLCASNFEFHFLTFRETLSLLSSPIEAQKDQWALKSLSMQKDWVKWKYNMPNSNPTHGAEINLTLETGITWPRKQQGKLNNAPIELMGREEPSKIGLRKIGLPHQKCGRKNSSNCWSRLFDQGSEGL